MHMISIRDCSIRRWHLFSFSFLFPIDALDNRSYRHRLVVEVNREVLPGNSLVLLVGRLAVVILSRWRHSKRPLPVATMPNSTSSTMRGQLLPEDNRGDTRAIHMEVDIRDSKVDSLASSREARTRIKLRTLPVRTGRMLIPPDSAAAPPSKPVIR